ncbi:putative ribonuclease H-like domain-containing protein [Tanacetum coccineum]|uniref:Ribonuclease H-like domain-containing protein n=1 Tax=Tanacetum coccineum TaxID=301880 RepID=A0ABQ5BSK7_9ASTR
MSYHSKKAYSTVNRPIHKDATFKNSNFNQRFNTVKDKNVNTTRPKAVVNAARPKAVVNAVKGNNVMLLRPQLFRPRQSQMDLQDHGLIDSGCSRNMTGNMSYLTDYEEIDGGYVAFGGNPKGGKITGKGHLNFKTINKLVKGNLVRGLPSKRFENDQNRVACQKGKQHRASFVIADFSRFTWVFFLATKDETSGILKSFIFGIENLVDHKVKVIGCDNETEFKNKEMNQFCEMKGADITKIPRKRLKTGKHEHGNRRARKEPGKCYIKGQWSTQVNLQHNCEVCLLWECKVTMILALQIPWVSLEAIRAVESCLGSCGIANLAILQLGIRYDEHFKTFRFYVIEPNESVSINSIIESRDAIFEENRFSSVSRPSRRSLVNENEDSGGSVVPEKVTDEVV